MNYWKPGKTKSSITTRRFRRGKPLPWSLCIRKSRKAARAKRREIGTVPDKQRRRFLGEIKLPCK